MISYIALQTAWSVCSHFPVLFLDQVKKLNKEIFARGLFGLPLRNLEYEIREVLSVFVGWATFTKYKLHCKFLILRKINDYSTLVCYALE